MEPELNGVSGHDINNKIYWPSTPLISISILLHPSIVYTNKMANRAAWIISEKANPLRVDDAPTQRPEPGTIMIKNHAAAVVSTF